MVDNFDERDNREPSAQIAGRFVGIAVFLTGIILLVLTFVLAYQAFHNPDLLLPPRFTQQNPAISPTYLYARSALLLVLLFIMGYVASLIAARGAQLFFTARKEVRHGTAGD